MTALAVMAAFFSGFLLAPALFRRWEMRRRRPEAGGKAVASLSVGGLDALLIRKACELSARSRTPRSPRSRLEPSGRVAREIELAGLSEEMDEKSFGRSRLRSCVAFSAAGALVGCFVSEELSLLLCAVGFGFGWNCLRKALSRESSARSEEVERGLPEMAEVVAMGLRSGMSFDRALELYCLHFDGGLARAFGEAQRRWTMGLSTREQALRGMAKGFDSSLLSRMVESTVRSLRYGSSLASALDAFAEEAREARRSRLEERIAKTPVKMMLPVGTLILPAMLMMVLGPVLLELAQGF